MQAQSITRDDVHAYVETIIGDTEHAKRVLSIANAVTGVVHGAALAIHAIGAALANASGGTAKHATKQVDRLLSNAGFDLERQSPQWVRHVIGEQTDIVVALDWTDYDADGQATISLALVPKRGRAIPLLWRTVYKADLLSQRNRYEDELLVRLHERIPPGVRVTVTADRGFADQKLLTFMQTLGFDYVIRIHRTTTVYREPLQGRAAWRWLKGNGQVHVIRDALVTQDHTPVPLFVSVQKPAMKEAWYLVSSRKEWTGQQVIATYGRRFTIEEMFRDEKDWRYGLGLSHTRIANPKRRDRLLFLAALARDLLTLLGAAGESLGFDRMLKVNTVLKRTHSLYRQGCHYYASMPNMKPDQYRALIHRFGEMVFNSQLYLSALGLNQYEGMP